MCPTVARDRQARFGVRIAALSTKLAYIAIESRY